jgi:hypothetical protein
MNTTKHSNLYKHDMRPVFRSANTNNKWVRIRNPVRFSKVDDSSPLAFDHVIDSPDGKVSFAFTYPYTYTMVQGDLETLSSHCNLMEERDSIYYHRELLSLSPENRRVDLLTITSVDGTSGEREAKFPNLFPDFEEERPFIFPDKEIIFVSARVHPGEVPAQHTFKGILDFLLDRNDMRATELRRRYVFKLVPMLNPDG